MIRAAAAADLPQLTALWKVCFGDEEAVIHRFLQRLNQDVTCRVIEREGQIVSAAYLIDAKMVTSKGLVPVWYEYALGTLPAYRGQGLMTRLLENIKKEARRRKIACTALVPASEQLARFYEQQGYRWYFTVRSAQLSRDQLMRLGEKAATEGLPKEEPEALRERLVRPLTGSLQWSAAAVQFALDFHELCGGIVVKVPGGYAVGYEKDDTLYVTEWMSTPRSAPLLARELAGRTSCPKVNMRLTEYNPLFPGVGEIMPFAMVRSTGSEPPPKPCGAYLGLEMN